jgi:hypothetical protein
VCTAADNKSYYVAPNYSTLHPGGGRLHTVMSLEGAIIRNSSHIFAVTGRYSLDPDDTKTYTHDLGHESHSFDLRIFGTAFFSYLYERQLFPFVWGAVGAGAGYQLTERDRQWDSTGVFFTSAEQTQKDTLHVRYAAEGKFHSLGGPVARISTGKRPVRIGAQYRLNMGFRKNYGGYTLLDDTADNVYFPGDLEIERVKLANAGLRGRQNSVLEEGFDVLSQWTFFLIIYL